MFHDVTNRAQSRSWDPLLAGIPSVSAEALGLHRVVFATLLAFAVVRRRLPTDPFPPEVHNHAGGVADWPVFHWLASRPDLVALGEELLVVALVLLAIGFFSRLSLAVVAVLMTIWVLVRLQHTGVHEWAILLPAVVGMLPAGWGDGFSVDETIRRWRGRGGARRHGRYYGFGVWLPGFVLGLGFAGAAVAKLRQSGLAWILGGAVKYHFVIDARNAPLRWGLWVASHHPAAVLMSFMAVWLEGTVIVGSFVRQSARRLLFGLEALLLLLGFYVFQNELWMAWWILALSFLPWNWIYSRAASSLPLAVALVDGRCPLCRRSARVFHGLDWFNRIEFVDANDPAVRSQYAASTPLAELLRDMHVVGRGRGDLSRGYRAYLALARAVPFMWPVVSIGLLPPVAAVGERVYRYVARWRRRDGPCTDDVCAIHGDLRESVSIRSVVPSALPGTGAALRPIQLVAIASVCLLQLTASVLQLEVQPWMSDYPMYASTFSSTEEFDRRNPVKRVYHFRRDPPAGASEDISKALDDIPDADVVVIQAVSQLAETGELSSEQRARVRAISVAFERRMQRPVGRVTLLMSEEAFDWQRGRFYWKKVGALVGTLDTDTLTLVKSDSLQSYPPP